MGMIVACLMLMHYGHLDLKFEDTTLGLPFAGSTASLTTLALGPNSLPTPSRSQSVTPTPALVVPSTPDKTLLSAAGVQSQPEPEQEESSPQGEGDADAGDSKTKVTVSRPSITVSTGPGSISLFDTAPPSPNPKASSFVIEVPVRQLNELAGLAFVYS